MLRNDYLFDDLSAVEKLASRLLTPTVLDESLSSGVFVLVDSKVKGNALLNQLAILLADGGAHVTHLLATDLVGQEIQASLAQVFGSQHTLSVLLLEEAQELLLDPAGDSVLRSLKAARDAMNLSHLRPGKFILIATGTSPADILRLVSDPLQAFYGATAATITEFDV